jgi:GxxExxY protein
MQNMNHEEHEEDEGFTKDAEGVATIVVDCGLKVHRVLGAGLLESAYELCLAHELQARGLDVRRQVLLPLRYDTVTIETGYRLDLIVNGAVVIEVKSVDALLRVHEAQVLTYMKLSGCRVGFLMNFNVPLFKQGLRRFVL